MPHNFWMINCNERNFDITRELGFAQQGLKAEYRRKVQRVEPGDRVIYYVSGSRVFTATATVTKGYEEVKSTPWLREGKTAWPYLIGIQPNVVLEPDKYIDAGLIAYRLEYLRKWAPEDWHMAFQGNLHLLSKGDFFLLESEMLKLRDGREAAIREIERQLAAETERVGALQERRRRAAERENPRPAPRGRNGHAPEPSKAPPDEPEQPADTDAPPAKAQTAAGRNRQGNRNRRHRNAGRNRKPAAGAPPRFDND